MALSEEQIHRYSRHILLPEVGGAGQEKLLAARALVRGEMPLVEWASAYLAAAGARIDERSGAGLAISVGACAFVVVRKEAERILVLSDSDPDLLGEPSGPIGGEAAAIAACLAASECLRLILQIGPPARAWEIRGAKVAHCDFAALA